MQLLKITSTPIEYKIKTHDGEYKEKEKTDNVDSSSSNNSSGNQQICYTVSLSTNNLKLADGQTFVSDSAMKSQQTSSGNIIYNKADIIKAQNADTKSPKKDDEVLVKPNKSSAKNTNSTKLTEEIVEETVEEEAGKEYVPGFVELEVLERPKVDIEYLGGFTYVPESSDPDYKEEE